MTRPGWAGPTGTGALFPDCPECQSVMSLGEVCAQHRTAFGPYLRTGHDGPGDFA